MTGFRFRALFLVFFLLLSFEIVVVNKVYAITEGHPKIFADRLQAALMWINNDNPPEWQEIKTMVTSGTSPDIARINAFVYQIEGDVICGRRAVDMMLAKMDVWAGEYEQWWDAGGKNGQRHYSDLFPSPWSQENITFVWAPVYDWTFDLMTDEERNKVIQVINRLVYGPVGRLNYAEGNRYPLDPAGNTILQPPLGSPDPPHEVTTQTPSTWIQTNHSLSSYSVEFMWSLASYPENPEAQRMANAMVATYEYAIRDQYNQYVAGGGMWEGNWYSRNMFDIFSYVVLAFPGALGEYFYDQFVNDNPWLTDYMYYMIYSTYPWPLEGSLWNFQRSSYRYVTGISQAYSPGGLQYRDVVVLWKISHIVQSPVKEHAYWYLDRIKELDYVEEKWVEKLLFYDPEMVPQEPSSLPLFYHSEGMGHIFSRSDWSNDATWLSFSGGEAVRYYGSGAELGAFNVHKYTHLTGDSYHFNSAMSRNHGLAVLNNCMLIGEIIDVGGWRESWNYGGQIGWWNFDIGEPEPGHAEPMHGKMAENTYEYTYIAADLKGAYLSNMVEMFDREIVFIRPDYVIVFDRVRTTQPDIRKRFAAQFRNEPYIDGDITTATNRIYVDDDPRNDEAKIFVKTLLPEDYVITKVGPGYNGQGGPNSGAGNSWHIEVESQTGTTNKDGLFLHVFYPTLGTTPSMPPTEPIYGTNMTGAQTADKIVMFNKSYGTIESGQFDINTSGTYRAIIADLIPNTSYDISIDGVPLGAYAATNGGLLVFDLPITGGQSVTINSGPPDDVEPAAITDLGASTGTQPGAVDLTWTATGDDGDVGTATSYIIRYSDSAITAANWDSATDVSGEPSPQSSGTGETFTIADLIGGQTYHFAVKAQDEAGNISNVSSSPSAVAAVDTTPPAISGITSSDITEVTATITWTANESADSVVEYGITAIYGSVSSDATLKTEHSQTLTVLSAGTEYHYRVMSTDASGNTATSDDFTFATTFGTLLSDNFDDGDMQGWTIVDEGVNSGPSDWSVQDGKLSQSSNIYGPTSASDNRKGTFAYWDAAEAMTWEDYSCEVTIQSTDDDGIGLMFYYQDPSNYYKVDLDEQRSFSKLFKMLNGTQTTLANVAGSYTQTVDMQLKVEVIENEIIVTFDGDNIFGGPIMDSDLTGGTVALYCWGNTGAIFDNVRVNSYSQAGPEPLSQPGKPIHIP